MDKIRSTRLSIFSFRVRLESSSTLVVLICVYAVLVSESTTVPREGSVRDVHYPTTHTNTSLTPTPEVGDIDA